jgi:ABC-type transport system involved in multi-copper enzyme maturation permease subunit
MFAFAIPIARYTLVEAMRNRLMWLLLAGLAAAVVAAGFLQQVAITEAARVQASVIAAAMRLFAVFLIAAFVVTAVVREMNDKVLEVLLAKPMPRASWLLGKGIGFTAVAAVIAVIVALPLWFFGTPSGVAAWTLSLFLELTIVAAAALFCVLTLNQVVTALAAVFGFYLLARTVAAAQIIAGAAPATTWSDRLTGGFVDGIAALLPAIDRMTQTVWVLDGPSGAAFLTSVVVPALVYVALLGAAAAFDLYRQNF